MSTLDCERTTIQSLDLHELLSDSDRTCDTEQMRVYGIKDF